MSLIAGGCHGHGRNALRITLGTAQTRQAAFAMRSRQQHAGGLQDALLLALQGCADMI